MGKSRIQKDPTHTAEGLPERKVVEQPQEVGKSGPSQWTRVKSLRSLVMDQVVLGESCGSP